MLEKLHLFVLRVLIYVTAHIILLLLVIVTLSDPIYDKEAMVIISDMDDHFKHKYHFMTVILNSKPNTYLPEARNDLICDIKLSLGLL